MNRKASLALLAALALAACGEKKDAAAPAKTGPAVAKGEGITITADELKARLDEQSPFIRQRFTSAERKREFLDNLVRFELLAREAEKQGLAKDPDVQLTLKRIMVQKLVQKSFAADPEAAKSIPEADLRAYYDAHPEEYRRPERLRVAHLLVKAPAGGPERAKAEAKAKKLLGRLRAEEKANPGAFAALVREASDDAGTKALGGDLGFRTREELAAQLSAEAAAAAAALPDGQTAGPLTSPQGFHLVRRLGGQEAVERPFDQVKPQIAAKLQKDRRSKEFDDFVKGLREKANVKIDEAELEKVTVSAGAPPGAMQGMGGPMGGPMPMGGPVAPGAPAAPPPGGLPAGMTPGGAGPGPGAAAGPGAPGHPPVAPPPPAQRAP
jgi:peptidyl-prolyl cis-trans isomerase C